MSRLRAADGGGAAAKRAKLPLIRCKGLEGVKVAGSVFIEKLTDSELICFSEANGYRLPSGTKLGKVKETHTGLIFFSLPLSFFTSPPHYDEFLCRFVNIITVRPSSYVISFSFFSFFFTIWTAISSSAIAPPDSLYFFPCYVSILWVAKLSSQHLPAQ